MKKITIIIEGDETTVIKEEAQPKEQSKPEDYTVIKDDEGSYYLTMIGSMPVLLPEVKSVSETPKEPQEPPPELPKPEEPKPYVLIENGNGEFVEPEEPRDFLSSRKAKAALAFGLVMGVLIYVWFSVGLIHL